MELGDFDILYRSVGSHDDPVQLGISGSALTTRTVQYLKSTLRLSSGLCIVTSKDNRTLRGLTQVSFLQTSHT